MAQHDMVVRFQQATMNTVEKLDAAINDLENKIKKVGVPQKGGKKYVQVVDRLQSFRKFFPDAQIETNIISNNPITIDYKGKSVNTQVVVIRATITIDGKILATGIAEEFRHSGSMVNITSYIENCETSAIGRALAALNLGGGENYASKDEIDTAVRKAGDLEAPKISVKSERPPQMTKELPTPEWDNLTGKEKYNFFSDEVKRIKDPAKINDFMTKYNGWITKLNPTQYGHVDNAIKKRLQELTTFKKGKVNHE